jgi:hypothetical protein
MFPEPMTAAFVLPISVLLSFRVQVVNVVVTVPTPEMDAK